MSVQHANILLMEYILATIRSTRGVPLEILKCDGYQLFIAYFSIYFPLILTLGYYIFYYRTVQFSATTQRARDVDLTASFKITNTLSIASLVNIFAKLAELFCCEISTFHRA